VLILKHVNTSLCAHGVSVVARWCSAPIPHTAIPVNRSRRQHLRPRQRQAADGSRVWPSLAVSDVGDDSARNTTSMFDRSRMCACRFRFPVAAAETKPERWRGTIGGQQLRSQPQLSKPCSPSTIRHHGVQAWCCALAKIV